MSKVGEQFWRATLASLFGPLLWALHFGFVYGGQHVGCAPPVSAAPVWIKAGVAAVTIVIAAPLLIASISPQALARLIRLTDTRTNTHVFFLRTMRLLSILSLFAVFWAGAAVFALPACPALR